MLSYCPFSNVQMQIFKSHPADICVCVCVCERENPSTHLHAKLTRQVDFIFFEFSTRASACTGPQCLLRIY